MLTLAEAPLVRLSYICAATSIGCTANFEPLVDSDSALCRVSGLDSVWMLCSCKKKGGAKRHEKYTFVCVFTCSQAKINCCV